MTGAGPWTDATIVRTWKGWIRSADRQKYAEYLEETGLSEYRETPGNRGAFVMWRAEGERTEVTTVSFWDSLESITAFAGDDIATAVFYPEDDAYLIERDTVTRHYELGEGGPLTPA
jgi:heme-degrading monooxygenase HmoA